MVRSANASLLAGLVCVLWFGIRAGSAAGAEEVAAESSEAAPFSETVEAGDVAEERYELLAAQLASALGELLADSGADEVLLVELEELRAVAEEILIEGDAETAVLLLEEAVALLPAHGEE